MLRVGGLKIGLITLIFDITKGFIPIKLLLIFNQQEMLALAIFGVIFADIYILYGLNLKVEKELQLLLEY